MTSKTAKFEAQANVYPSGSNTIVSFIDADGVDRHAAIPKEIKLGQKGTLTVIFEPAEG